MKRLLLVVMLCCLSVTFGYAGLDSDTKLNASKSKEALIQEKIDALYAQKDNLLAEFNRQRKNNDQVNKTIAVNDNETLTKVSSEVESNEVAAEEKDDRYIDDMKLFFDVAKIDVNVAKAYVELQKIRVKAGKTAKEYVKLAKLILAVTKAHCKLYEANFKISKIGFNLHKEGGNKLTYPSNAQVQERGRTLKELFE